MSVEDKSDTVCFLSFGPTYGGVTTHQAYQLQYLVSNGVDCALIDEKPETTLERLPATLASQVSVTKIPLWSQTAKTGEALKELLSRVAPQSGCVVISNMGLVVKYSALVQAWKQRTGGRLIFFAHSRVFRKTIKNFLMELICAVKLRQFDEIIYVSNFTRVSWERRYFWLKQVPNRVIMNGVPLAAPLKFQQQNFKRVGFVGRLEPEKDPALFAAIAQECAEHRLPFQFSIIGEGALLKKIRADHPPNLEFQPPSSDPKRPYEGLDILLVTSEIENCPFAVLEAKNLGIPCVGPNVGGMSEVVKQGVDGLLVNERSVPAYVGALLKMSESYDSFVEGCLSEREKYNVTLACRRIWIPHLESLRKHSA